MRETQNMRSRNRKYRNAATLTLCVECDLLIQRFLHVGCLDILHFFCMTLRVCENCFLSTHAYRQGVDISVTVCLFCVFVCIRLRISPPRIKLAASNFARWFIGVLSKESPIFENFAPQKPKIGRIGQPPGSKV